jgi:plasmid stabilization system protein ParE
MNYQFVPSSGADADISSIIRWYLNIDSNLALRFLIETKTVLRRIIRMPYSFPRWAGAFRRAKLNRFPYFIYYTVEMNIVTVAAVLHQRRSDTTPIGRG